MAELGGVRRNADFLKVCDSLGASRPGGKISGCGSEDSAFGQDAERQQRGMGVGDLFVHDSRRGCRDDLDVAGGVEFRHL